MKLDVAPRRSRARPRQAETQRPWLLARSCDVLAVLLLMLCSFPAVWLAHRSVTFVPDLGLIDDNWHLDSTFKALRGIWIGRDVAFTHGPIFQALSSVPARSMPLSLGALYATWDTIPLWCAAVFVYLALRLILPEQPPWKRAILLLLLATFWETSLRSTVPVLLFAYFLRAWYAVHAGRMRSAYAGAIGAVLCVVAFLVAADVGIYTTAAWFICWIAIAVEMRHQHFARKLFAGLSAFGLAALILAVIVNSFMARPFNFKFWRDSLAQVAAYRWATPVAMTREGTRHLLVALAMCAAIFVLQAVAGKRLPSRITQRPAFLLGAFGFGLAVMQSALVRSDLGHVIIGEFALIFFAATILFSFRGKSSIAGMVIAVAISIAFSHPVFSPAGVVHLYRQLRRPMTQCPPGYSAFDQACYADPLTPRMLASGRDFLSRNSAGKDFIFVYPYQTMFGLAARRNVAGGLMQAYTASGPGLSKLEISGLEGRRVPAALYLPDANYRRMSEADLASWSRNYLSVPVDGIPNFTRAPEVWFWLVRHYRSVEQLTPGVVALLRDDSRASRVAWQAQPLGLPARTYPIVQRSSSINLGAPNWRSGFDFIRLRMTVRYPIWWKLRKPERLQLEITRADGSLELQSFIVQPNISTDVWFYPWDAGDLTGYFNADAAQWRPPARSSIIGLRIVATPLDWISQQPEAISIESTEGVRLVSIPQP
ncbi:MAG TPA: hypothetical protein VLV47_00520 [Candidatus Bathyarchaeia archaeon]|nr:hypothetical protein [Candidatus Bathyarchaeia archaeon]